MEWRCFAASLTRSWSNESREKLVWGKELYLDSTQVNANADLDSLMPRFAVEAREAMQTHLTTLFAREDTQHEQQEAAADRADTPCGEATATQVIACPVPPSLPVTLSEAEQEELAQDNAARHDWIAEQGRPQREVRGWYQRTSDLRISTTDPDATPMRLKGGGTHLGYHTHYVVDGGKRRIILAVLVTPGEVMDNHPMLDLLWHTCFRWHLLPKQVTADSLYGTGENLKAIEEAHIRAYIPIAERGQSNMGYYGLAQFIYDASQDLYRCPQGQVLRPTFRLERIQEMQYRADAAICNACPVKAQCTESPGGRRVHRSFFADYVERVKGYQQTAAYQKAINKRKVWVEPLFAEGKQWHGMARFRLRRLWRVNCEALVIATGQNLKRLLQKRGWGRRPFPCEAVAVAPPNWEEEEPFRGIKGNHQSRTISVALIAVLSLTRCYLGTQMSLFSQLIIVCMLSTSLLLCIAYFLSCYFYSFSPRWRFFGS
jgi:DDE family transposase